MTCVHLTGSNSKDCPKTAVLWLDVKGGRDETLKLHRDLAGMNNADVFWVVDATRGTPSAPRHPPWTHNWTFTHAQQQAAFPLAVPKNLRPPDLGTDGITALFRRQHRQYKFIWVIEQDVRFLGDWAIFIGSFCTDKTDLITTSTDKATPDTWGYAKEVVWPPVVDFVARKGWVWKSLIPVVRYSDALLRELE